jgi:hypothetical protein
VFKQYCIQTLYMTSVQMGFLKNIHMCSYVGHHGTYSVSLPCQYMISDVLSSKGSETTVHRRTEWNFHNDYKIKLINSSQGV